MEKRALFPGSFDPITVGHTWLISKALKTFDKVIVMPSFDTNKRYLFSLEERVELINNALLGMNGASCQVPLDDLTVKSAKKLGISVIVRGARTEEDFAHERVIAEVNHQLAPDIDTIIYISTSEVSLMSSSLVKSLAYTWSGEDFMKKMVNNKTLLALKEKMNELKNGA